MKVKKEFPEFCKSMRCHYHIRYLNRKKEDKYPGFPWVLEKVNSGYFNCADKLLCIYLPPHDKEHVTKELEFINFLWRKELGVDQNGKSISKNIRTNSI